MRRPAPYHRLLPTGVPISLLHRADLRATGATGRQITDAVRDGRLLRLRRDRYLAAGAHPTVCAAVRWGGRVDCVSVLQLFGVFVRETGSLHVQMAPDASRVPRPDDAAQVIRHWRTSRAAADATLAPLDEALLAAVRCQRPRDAIATLDSAWHLGVVDEARLNELFARLPRRYRSLRRLLDRRAESGTETLVRLMLRAIGCGIELQVSIDGVGRVDLLVDGWLLIECDSEAHHGTWQDHKRDRRRDAAAVALGYTPLRLLAEDILYRPEWVADLLRRTIATGPAGRRAFGSPEKRAR